MNTSDVQYTQISKYLIGEIVSKRLAENQIIQMRDISRITGISLFKVNEVLCSLSKNEILKLINMDMACKSTAVCPFHY